jgi:hypothetical protein
MVSPVHGDYRRCQAEIPLIVLFRFPEPALSAAASSKSAVQPDTKHARIIAMLRTPAGATIAAIMILTEWQQHSVRGFLAGVVRKKLGLNLVSEPTDKGRVYRIKDGKASSATVDRVKKAA